MTESSILSAVIRGMDKFDRRQENIGDEEEQAFNISNARVYDKVVSIIGANERSMSIFLATSPDRVLVQENGTHGRAGYSKR